MKKNKLKPTFFNWLVLILIFIVCFHVANAAEYASLSRRDPFVPLVGVPREASGGGIWGVLTIDDVVLQGITVEPDGTRSVIINDEVMQEGDKAGRLSIESITDNVVKIKIDDKEFEKKLYEKEGTL